MFETQAASDPDADAIVAGADTISYGALRDAISYRLYRAGVGRAGGGG